MADVFRWGVSGKDMDRVPGKSRGVIFDFGEDARASPCFTFVGKEMYRGATAEKD